jgi:hypothetical protein
MIKATEHRSERAKKMNYKFLTETGEHNFDAIEKEVVSGSIGFGNPHSRLTPHEQFLHWKNLILSGSSLDRDEWSNAMAAN